MLREGKIIERGDHHGLLTRGGHYAELYNTCFRHPSLEHIEHALRVAAAAGSSPDALYS